MIRLLLVALLLNCGCVAPDASTSGTKLDVPAYFPAPLVPDDNPMTAEAIELGRYLFYDTRLSVNDSISCSSCHQQDHAFADDKPVSLGATGEAGVLNAPSLGNVIYAGTLTWAHSEVPRIEDQLLGPMFGESPLEMGMTGSEDQIIERLRSEPRYAQLFERAYPGQSINLDLVRLALASFVRSLVSYQSPFDDFLQGQTGAISASARRGSELFYSDRLGCAGCHSGFAFTAAATSSVSATGKRPSPFHNIGMYNIDGEGAYPDSARGLIDDSGLDSDMGRFRVPSLRNVDLTAPYGHDGSVETLEDFVRMYEAGGRILEGGPNAGDGRNNPWRSEELRSFELSDSERDDLLAFLRSLTDRNFVSDPRFSDPW